MVYCGSGTETILNLLHNNDIKILWSTAEAVLRLHNNKLKNIYVILWSTAEAVLRQFFL